MPKEYVLKKPAIDSNRIIKISKNLIDESNDDRVKALDAYRYFKALVDENPRDDASKNNMTACLKLAQSSKVNVTKLIDLLIKLESIKYSDRPRELTSSTDISFHELDE